MNIQSIFNNLYTFSEVEIIEKTKKKIPTLDPSLCHYDIIPEKKLT